MSDDSRAICAVTACGYTCDRDEGHGMIHHNPSQGPLGHDDWWMLQPHNYDEEIGIKRWTGYLLIHDCALPNSGNESRDIRFVELQVTALQKKYGRIILPPFDGDFIPTTPATKAEIHSDGAVTFIDPVE